MNALITLTFALRDKPQERGHGCFVPVEEVHRNVVIYAHTHKCACALDCVSVYICASVLLLLNNDFETKFVSVTVAPCTRVDVRPRNTWN